MTAIRGGVGELAGLREDGLINGHPFHAARVTASKMTGDGQIT